MNRAKKVFIFLVVLLSIFLTIYFSGLLVSIGLFERNGLIEVPKFDILTHQTKLEEDILEDFKKKDYTFNSPYVVVNPYDMNPLSALVIFESNFDSDYEVIISSKDNIENYSYIVERNAGRVEIPILALYPGYENSITIKSNFGQTEFKILTENLPIDFQKIIIQESKFEKISRNFYLLGSTFSHSYSFVMDANGSVRAYFNKTNIAHGTTILELNNGNLLITGDEYKQIPYNKTSLWEINWLGKIFKEFEIPNGVHHDVFQFDDDNLLVASNNKDMFNSGTREDVAIIIDNETGQIIDEYDFRNILDEKRNPNHHFHPNIQNPINVDWMHMNGVLFNEDTNSIIVSSPTQSMIVSVDKNSKEIQWILGPHEGFSESSEFLEKYLLNPTGENFEWSWAQHHPVILEDIDDNPRTIDLLLFDNGQSRSYFKENEILAENNYSRAVHYRIDVDQGTVKQIWTFGKELGSQEYATFLGDANKYEDSYLITFGGQLRSGDKPVDDIFGGVLGEVKVKSRIIQVNSKNEILFNVKILPSDYDLSGETYQTQIIDLYNHDSFDYNLSDNIPIRLGNSNFNTTESQFVPNIYFGKISVSFGHFYQEGNRLIIDGNIKNNGMSYLLSQGFIVFKNYNKEYVFKANSGLNGQFFASIDLNELDKGKYKINILAGVKEGNDILKGDMITGYTESGYFIDIE